MTRTTKIIHAYRRDSRGVAGIEFAACASVLVIGLLNAVDVGYYIYKRMQVEIAAQVGAQAAWKTCYDQKSMLPATQNCSGLNKAITTAIQSTTLRTAVTLASGYPTEGYYCVTASNTLQSVGTLFSKPADCSAAGNSALSPGDYIQVKVTYTYVPLFKGITVIYALGITSLNSTSWMRLG